MIHIIPTYRFTVYAMGIYLGYLLREHKDIKLSNLQLTVGWIVSSALFIATFVGSAFMNSYNYVSSPLDGALFTSLGHITFCLFFGWVLYTAHLGYKSIPHSVDF